MEIGRDAKKWCEIIESNECKDAEAMLMLIYILKHFIYKWTEQNQDEICIDEPIVSQNTNGGFDEMFCAQFKIGGSDTIGSKANESGHA